MSIALFITYSIEIQNYTIAFENSSRFIEKFLSSIPDLANLLLDVDALDAVADTREDFVGDGVEGIAENGDWELVAKDDHLVALFAVDTCDVNHANIHADVADIWGFLSIDQAVAMTVAQMTVESVGITDGYGSYAAVAIHKTLSAVANGLPRAHITYLKNGGLQCRDVVQHLVGSWIDAVESKSKTHHVEMVLWEMLNTGRVADMADDLVPIDRL